MKTTLKGFALSALVGLLSANGAYLDFETDGQTNLGNIYLEKAENSATWTQDAAGGTNGVGGSRGATFETDAADFTYVLNESSLNDGSLEVSTMFNRVNQSRNSSYLQIGFTGGDYGFYGNGTNEFMSVRLRSQADDKDLVQMQLGNSGSPDTTDLGDLTSAATDGNWLKLSAVFTKSATANQFDYSVSILDMGTDGTATATSLFAYTGTLLDDAMYSSTDLNSAFRFLPGNVDGAVDNLSATTAVPEPASAVLLISCFSALLFRRNR